MAHGSDTTTCLEIYQKVKKSKVTSIKRHMVEKVFFIVKMFA